MKRLGALPVLSVAFLLLAPGSSARASCQTSKLTAGGKLARSVFACHARAARGGAAVDPSCVAKAEAKLAAAFARAEAGGGCGTSGDAVDVETGVEADAASVVAALRPVGTASRCASDKILAAGKYAYQTVRAERRNQEVPDATRLAADRTAAAQKLYSRFLSLSSGSDCLTSHDGASTGTGLDSLVSSLVTRLFPPPPPVCGNGIVESGEQCDGTNLGSCSGLYQDCAPDCTCGRLICGFGCYDLNNPCCNPGEVCINGPGIFGDQCVDFRCSTSDDCASPFGTQWQCENGACCPPLGSLCLTQYPYCCGEAICPSSGGATGTCCLPAGAGCSSASSCCSQSCNASSATCD
jgi:hypothetical protein